MAQRSFGMAGVCHVLRGLLDPGIEARIFAHFCVELQRKQVPAPAKSLMGIDMAGGQQFRVWRQGKRVAMPVQHRHMRDMAQRTVGHVHLHRVKAHFPCVPAIDIGAQRCRNHLRAKAHAQRRPVGRQAQRKAAHLAADPGMLDLVVDAHRPAHHDQ